MLLLLQTLSRINLLSSRLVASNFLVEAYALPSIMGLQRPVHTPDMRADSRYPHVLYRRRLLIAGGAPPRLGAMTHAHTSPFPAI